MISHGVVRARSLISDQEAQAGAPNWCLAELSGRLCELLALSAATESSALLTAATYLIADAQRCAEPVAWICAASALFFPPDLESNGVDLQALTILRVADAQDAAQAADQLLRSGCFGLLVIDLSAVETKISDAVLARLKGLVRTHQATVLFLCNAAESDRSALGSMVSFRACARSRVISAGRFALEIEVSRDKRRGTPWRWTETCNGPPGMS